MKKTVSAIITMMLFASPVTASTLIGTFTGAMSRGAYSLIYPSGDILTRSVLGGEYMATVLLGEGDFFVDQRASLILEDSTVPRERVDIATRGGSMDANLSFEYSNAQIRVFVPFQDGSTNTSGLLSLTADVIDRQLTNWRGSIFESGQLSNLIDFSFIGEMDSLQFSGTYSGIAQVPEPSSWALMIAGFALTGASFRRRQVTLAG